MTAVSNERLLRFLDALDSWWLAHACPPTMRQLTAMMGLRAYSNVHDVLAEARRRGLVSDDLVPQWVMEVLSRSATRALVCAEQARRAEMLRQKP